MGKERRERMIYQNILGEEAPYRMFVSSMGGFAAHRHAELELAYCMRGSYEILLDRQPYTVGEGELLLISPMAVHEIPPSYDSERQVLTLMLGPSLLREEYALFAATPFRTPVVSPADLTGEHTALLAALHEAAALAVAYTPAARLARLSVLYRIAAILSAALPQGEGDRDRELTKVAGIEPALELIWHSYRSPLRIEEAAAATGYGKSNFCKIFRRVTGETFHSALNRHRIRVACDLLSATDLPVAAVGGEVGLGEAKTFCRLFRREKGMTPGEYRKSARARTAVGERKEKA
jgi:AraC-like DNA-binding protein